MFQLKKETKTKFYFVLGLREKPFHSSNVKKHKKIGIYNITCILGWPTIIWDLQNY